MCRWLKVAWLGQVFHGQVLIKLAASPKNKLEGSSHNTTRIARIGENLVTAERIRDLLDLILHPVHKCFLLHTKISWQKNVTSLVATIQ